MVSGVRLVIVGGGGFRVPLIHRALARRPELAITELVLVDVDPNRLAVISNVIGHPAGLPGPELVLAASPADAIRGADFVFSAIRVGGAIGRVADERRALARGVIGQETVGAGGLGYGLRTLPVALELARTVAELAPQAWLINFTNPAGLITEALRPVLGDRVIGICDSPAGLIRRASHAAGSQRRRRRFGQRRLSRHQPSRLAARAAQRLGRAATRPARRRLGAAILRGGQAVRARTDPLARRHPERVPVLLLPHRRGAGQPVGRSDPGRDPARRAGSFLRRGAGQSGAGTSAVGGDPAAPGAGLPGRGSRLRTGRGRVGRRRLRADRLAAHPSAGRRASQTS